MTHTYSQSRRVHKLLSVVLSAALLLMLASPGVAVFANETSSTPEPVPVATPVVPEPAEEPVVVEPLPDDSTEPSGPELSPVVNESSPPAEQPAAEPLSRSEEPSPKTVTVEDRAALPAVGPRSDFPPPTTIGEGCDLTTIAIFWAGQNYEAGTVSVSNDQDTLYVTFDTTGGWTMSLTHLYVGLVPPASYAPGSFPYQTAHNPAVTTYTYEIPLASIGAGTGDTIYIAAHAEVANGQQSETAWAGVGQWPGLLFTHVIQECVEPSPSSITVVKFNDINQNGERDEGEPTLEGVEITIEGSQYTDSGLTDGDGQVVFGELSPDTYVIDEVVPDGWFATTELPLEVVLGEGENPTVYVGNAEEELPFTDIDLAIEKQADVETATAGDLITYTLTYENLGSTEATGFVIIDDYDETVVEVVDAAGGVVANGTITWELYGPLGPDDGQLTIVYTVRVLSPIPEGVTSVDNYVLISHPQDNNPENNDDEETVGVEPFLPFTPKPEPKPEPSVTETSTASDPYLPYTGGNAQTLIGLALSSILIGLALRRQAVKA